MKRLYIFTGKGGVGKTAYSLALTKYLQNQGHKVLYNSFDQAAPLEICGELEIESLELTNAKSASQYIEKKLGSAFIASWILKTPFFSSLFDMLPSLGHMILFGHLIQMLRDDPKLTLVMDSPSSGHALTMFEASYNFMEMFKSGLIVEDIKKMHEFLYEKESLKNSIIALPTAMASQEAVELKDKLEQLNVSSELLLNDSFLKNKDIANAKDLPEFLEKKLALEQDVLEKYDKSFAHSFQRYPSVTLKETVDYLTPHMEVLL